MLPFLDVIILDVLLGSSHFVTVFRYNFWMLSLFLSVLHVIIMTDSNTGSCLDPGCSGNGLQRSAGRGGGGVAEAEPDLPIGKGEDQLDSSRDGGSMMKDKEESIWDVMQGGSVANRVRILPIHS